MVLNGSHIIDGRDSKLYGSSNRRLFSKEVLMEMPETDIIYVDAFGTPLIVLDSYEAAFQLVVKKSSLYSSRFRWRIILSSSQHSQYYVGFALSWFTS